jgi:hypothetical protein
VENVFKGDVMKYEIEFIDATEIHYSVDDALAFINSHPGL